MGKLGKRSRLLALLLALALVFVAGCQAVAGVDFNAVLKKALKVTSSEGNQTLELKLLLDEEALAEMPEEDQELIKLFTSIKLKLDQVKLQDEEHMSMNGSLQLGDEIGIGFSLQMSDTLAVLELEGAKQPFVLDLTSESLLGAAAGINTEEADGLDDESLTALGHEALDTIGAYVIDNLPNPERIQVKPAVEPVNGSATSLMHVHAYLNGPEIWALVKKYVDALVADREGFESMIEGVFDILQRNPDVWEAIGSVNPFEEGGLDAPTPEELKEQAAEELFVMLEDLQAELARMDDEDQEVIEEMFSKDLVIKADMYVDSKLDIRKQLYELTYVPSEEETDQAAEENVGNEADPDVEYFDEQFGYGFAYGIGAMPFKGITIKLESEAWNVNGAVVADAPAETDDAFSAEALFEMQGYQFLKHFDESSDIYDLLKNKFHIANQTVTWYPYDEYNPAILTAAGITIIPLRDTADSLGASIEYNAKSKGIKLYDEATDTTVSVKIGSDKAVVNGKTETWSFPVTLVDGVSYVPARDLARVLRAKISWSEFYDDEKIFTLEREL
ncbi:copper amine oxidase N-terminal domain-containing protein [Paenibacillus sp. N4]|uniref:copper amine oxidase N-terminal domain-containing protein n=1 Tax=Paenibacillus vietnamensis TaxID=2590547 RepID=UPI001CD18AC2|nr:copper amine oxidase N-terminal domain-containing protein [Paenibacillus vietnamensis]MCA0755549.1 copper amine oxidase N-terminal domain-containing protein [Paenibacillus vietnamensis]